MNERAVADAGDIRNEIIEDTVWPKVQNVYDQPRGVIVNGISEKLEQAMHSFFLIHSVQIGKCVS